MMETSTAEIERKYSYASVAEDDESLTHEELLHRPRDTRRSFFTFGLIASVLLNLIAVIWITAGRWQGNASTESPLANTPLRAVPYQHFSPYSAESGDHMEVDDWWDKIRPYHGIVAVDTEWAKKQNLPPSQQAFVDPSKSHYVIDVYHQLHCLLYLRQSWYQLYDNRTEPLDRHIDHYGHCFDAIRQSLMCSASDQLLHTWGDGRSGNGDLRQCKDWGRLRDWAAEHSACESDPSTTRRQHLCTKGVDGLLDTIV